MNAIDTNIWLYSHDTRDPRKQAIAQQLIATIRPLALPWQVGCEFVAASRKLAAVGFTEAQAWPALAAMQSLADVILLPLPDLWPETQALQARYSLSFWDALLVSTCQRGNVQVLYTEDMARHVPSTPCPWSIRSLLHRCLDSHSVLREIPKAALAQRDGDGFDQVARKFDLPSLQVSDHFPRHPDRRGESHRCQASCKPNVPLRPSARRLRQSRQSAMPSREPPRPA